MYMIGITYRGAAPGSEALKPREWNRVQKEEFARVGYQWGEEYRPRHFAEDASQRYGYIARKGERLPRGSKAYERSYTGRKEAQVGHTRPLEFSGKSREASERYRVRGIGQGEAAGARVSMPTPTLNYRHPKSQIRMADELRSVTPAEENELGRFLEARVALRLRTATVNQTKQLT